MSYFFITVFLILPILSSVSFVYGYSLAFICGILTYYDFTHMRLPNVWIVVLMTSGLLLGSYDHVWEQGNELNTVIDLVIYKIFNVTIVFFITAFIIEAYSHFRKKQVMGMGDVKFIAATLIWLKLSQLPIFLWFAALSALTSILLQSLHKNTSFKQMKHIRFAFGPYLCLSLLVNFLYL